jgi:hypothetical protein
MSKRPVPRYDFKDFGAAIKAARTGRRESRKKVCDEILLSPYFSPQFNYTRKWIFMEE